MHIVQPQQYRSAVLPRLRSAVELVSDQSTAVPQPPTVLAVGKQRAPAVNLRRWSQCLGVMAIAQLAVGLGLPSDRAIAQTAPLTQAPLMLAQTPAAVNLLFVDPAIGNDESGSGRQNAPLRTITQALRVAEPNTVIMLVAGTYSAESGETFPLVLQAGVTIQGDPSARGQGILIQGGGTFLSPTSASQNVTILGANQAGLTGVTVTNPNPRGYGVWVESSNPTIVSNTFSGNIHDGIMVAGTSAPLIQGNHFVQNGANGISLVGSSQAEVRDNIFERTGYGINVAQNAAPRLLNNQVMQNRSGVIVQANARPLLRGNTIEGNQEDGLVAIAQAQPDLGTSTEPGNNVFRSNGGEDINLTAARQPISVIGNQANPPAMQPANAASNPASRAVAPPTTAAPTALPTPVSPTPAPATRPPAPAPAPAPPNTRPAAPSSNSDGFGNLPQLEPAPIPTLPPQSAVPSSVDRSAPPNDPTPRLMSVQSAVPTPAPPEAIEIPVTPPAARSTPPATRSPAPVVNTARSQQSIEIPVPPPAATASRPSAPLREVVVARPAARPERGAIVQPAQGGIEIPVPPPETAGATARSSASRSVPTPPQTVAAAPSANLLPVPGEEIPMGNIGDMPTVEVSRDPLRRTASLPPAANGNRATALGLRYRIVVEAASESEQNQVRSLIPGAFRTQANGRVVMQAGAYSDRANADEAAQLLNSNGFRATVQAIE